MLRQVKAAFDSCAISTFACTKERVMWRLLCGGFGLSALLSLGGCFSTDGIVYTRDEFGSKVPISGGDYICVSGIGVGKDPAISHVHIAEKALATSLSGGNPQYEYQLGGGSVQFVHINGSFYVVDVSQPLVGDDTMPSQALRAAFIDQNTLQMLSFADNVVVDVAARSGVSVSHDPIMGWTLGGSAGQQRSFFGALLASTTGVTVDEACAPSTPSG